MSFGGDDPQKFSLFVYGTLRDAKVLNKVLQHDQGSSDLQVVHGVTLKGFKRYKVKNEKYPAAIETTGSVIENGGLITGLNSQDITKLDGFEGDQYRRINVTVQVQGKDVETQVYEWIDSRDRLVDEEWEISEDIEEFYKTII